jgi:general secretion pathway protein G
LQNRRQPHRIVVKHFQVRLALASMLNVVVGAAVFALTVFGPLVLKLLSRDTAEGERQRIADTFLSLHSTTWVGLGLMLVVTALSFLVSSHRVAGPLVRFQHVFRSLARGDLSARVRLREQDWLHEEAASLDGAVRGLERRVLAIRAHAQRAEASIRVLRAAVDDGRPGDTARALADLEAEAESLRAHLDRFATRTDHPPTPLPGSSESSWWRSKAGFSVAELLVALAIAGTLFALAAPLYTRALGAARVSRATAEVRSMGREVTAFLTSHGHLPATLAEASPNVQPDPWGHPYVYVLLLGGGGAGRTDKSGTPLNVDFDLYSVGRDGLSSASLADPVSFDDIVRAANGGFAGEAAEYNP